MQILNEGDKYLLKESQIVTMFSMNDFVLEINDSKEKRSIDGFSLFVLEIEDEANINISEANTLVIITEFTIK